MEPFNSQQTKAIPFAINRLFIQGAEGVGVLLRMGLGKTRVALEIIHRLRQYNEITSAVVVAPKRVINEVWPVEIGKWKYPLSFKIFKRGDRFFRGDADVLLCSVDMTHHLLDHAHQFDLLLADESTKFKNWSIKRTRAIRKIAPEIPKRIILTGTPAPNSEADLHSQIFILDKGEALGRTVTAFRKQYMYKGGWQNREWKLKPEAKQAILDKIAPMCFFGDNSNLPPVLVEDSFVQLPSSALHQHKRMKRKLVLELEENRRILAKNAGSAYAKCKQIANGFCYDREKNIEHVHNSKLEYMQEAIEELQGAQAIIAYHYTADADRLRNYLKLPDDPAQISGKIYQSVEDWLAKKRQILLLQIQSGGHGLNLQTSQCAYLFFYSMPDGQTEMYEQIIGRLRRQGGAECVIVKRVLAEDTVDLIIRDRIDGRVKNQEDFLSALLKWAKGN